MYKKYIDKISAVQQKLDSIQVAVLQNPSLDLKQEYKVAYSKINETQNRFLNQAKDKYIYPIIKGSLRSNPPEILIEIVCVPPFAFIVENVDFTGYSNPVKYPDKFA